MLASLVLLNNPTYELCIGYTTTDYRIQSVVSYRNWWSYFTMIIAVMFFYDTLYMPYWRTQIQLWLEFTALQYPIQYSFIKKMTKHTSDKRNNKHEWWNDKIQKKFLKWALPRPQLDLGATAWEEWKSREGRDVEKGRKDPSRVSKRECAYICWVFHSRLNVHLLNKDIDIHFDVSPSPGSTGRVATGFCLSATFSVPFL